MAKKAKEEVQNLDASLPIEKEEAPIERPKVGNLSERKSDKIPIKRYLKLYGSEIHIYTRAYLREQFRDIMKSKSEWDKEINKIMEGDR